MHSDSIGEMGAIHHTKDLGINRSEHSNTSKRTRCHFLLLFFILPILILCMHPMVDRTSRIDDSSLNYPGRSIIWSSRFCIFSHYFDPYSYRYAQYFPARQLFNAAQIALSHSSACTTHDAFVLPPRTLLLQLVRQGITFLRTYLVSPHQTYVIMCGDVSFIVESSLGHGLIKNPASEPQGKAQLSPGRQIYSAVFHKVT